ncbi:MAG: homoserine dehydrogenase [Gemmataceae bacterium]
MADALGIALVGCGTVGTGVVRLLQEQAPRLQLRAGRPLQLRQIVVRDLHKPREVKLPTNLLGTTLEDALADPLTHVVVELIGGTTTAKDVVLSALNHGKHVVTANKALLAQYGPELFEAARRAGRAICFEGAVAGGIPIIRALAESLAANQVTALQGILNGTSNYILTAMADDDATYAEALAAAQRLGYAEADPTLDVDGSDAAHKLAVLAQIVFGVTPQPAEIDRRGIAGLDKLDIRFAKELGYTIKLLAEAWSDESAVALHVAPVLIRQTDMLAQVRGAYNAVQVMGDAVGELLFQGPGAGMLPTASSVVADLIDIAVGRAQKTFQAANLWSSRRGEYRVERAERVQSRFYLRLMVRDQPGVLADVCRILANQDISISSVIQHEAPEDSREGQSTAVPLVIVTHYAATGSFRRAVDTIGGMPSLAATPVYFSVDD